MAVNAQGQIIDEKGNVVGQTNLSTGQVVNAPPPGTFAGQPLDASKLSSQPSFVNPYGVPPNDVSSKSLDMTAGVPGLVSQLASYLANKSATTGAELSTAKNTSTTLLSRLSDAISNRPTSATLLANKQAELGIPADLQSIKDLVPEVASLRDELNKLNTEEATLTENLYGQGRGIPTAILEGQAAKIQRQYAIRKAAVSADLSSKAALMEALRGNISLSNSLATQAVDAAVADTQQQVDDYKLLYSFNQDIISNLTTEQRDTLDKQYNMLQDELAQKRSEKEKVMQLAIDNPAANISINDTLESAAQKVQKSGGSLQARQEARLGNTSSAKNPLTLSDWSAYQKAGVKIPLSLVGYSENDIINSFYSPNPPKWFLDELGRRYDQSLLPTSDLVTTAWKTFQDAVQNAQPANSLTNDINSLF